MLHCQRIWVWFLTFCFCLFPGGFLKRWEETHWTRNPTMNYWSKYFSQFCSCFSNCDLKRCFSSGVKEEVLNILLFALIFLFSRCPTLDSFNKDSQWRIKLRSELGLALTCSVSNELPSCIQVYLNISLTSFPINWKEWPLSLCWDFFIFCIPLVLPSYPRSLSVFPSYVAAMLFHSFLLNFFRSVLIRKRRCIMHILNQRKSRGKVLHRSDAASWPRVAAEESQPENPIIRGCCLTLLALVDPQYQSNSLF